MDEHGRLQNSPRTYPPIFPQFVLRRRVREA